MAREPKTLLEHAFVGLRSSGMSTPKAMLKAAEAGAVVAQLIIAARDLGHWPSQVEYADYWKVTDRTAQREWALFRVAFPQETGPERIARLVADASPGTITQDDAAAVLAWPMPPTFAAA